MGLTSKLNGHTVTSARAWLPSWGCWYAEAAVDGDVALTGSVTLTIADLTLRGAILSGGADKGRSFYRIVGGAGGWGRTIPAKSYANDAGVKRTSVLVDAAREAGETLDASSIPTGTLGGAWTRPAGRACDVLQAVAPAAWYVGEDGTTRLGARPSSALPAGVTRGSVDRARGTVTLASDSIAAIVPGVVVDGLTAADVCHDLKPEGLRSTVWADQGHGSRELAAFARILEQLDPGRRFRGLHEYRVVNQSAERLELQPVRVSSCMPDARRVHVRPGVSGARSTVALGSLVLVGFVDASPSRPVVLAFEDAEGDGFVPPMTHIDADELRLGAGLRRVACETDTAGPFAIVASPLQRVKA